MKNDSDKKHSPACKVAVLDDDTEMIDFIKALLLQCGHKASLFSTPGKFLDSLDREVPDFLVLDMNLPGISGRDMLKVLRANPRTSRMLILAISGAMKETSDVITGLDIGADDYMLKPFDGRTFLLRVESLLARAESQRTGGTAAEEEITVGPLIIGLESHRIVLDGVEVELTNLEFELLVYFIRQRNRVVSRSHLLQNVWKGDPVMSTRAVDKRVETLRAKLGKFGSHIETIFGIGYMFRI
ncbi:MAG: response regulator transcription factor [bacterium]